MANNNIGFIRGDTKILLITVTDNDAAAYTPNARRHTHYDSEG